MFPSPGADGGFNLYDSGQGDSMSGAQFLDGGLLQTGRPDEVDLRGVLPGTPLHSDMNPNYLHSPSAHPLTPAQGAMSAWSLNNEETSGDAPMQSTGHSSSPPPLSHVNYASKRPMNAGYQQQSAILGNDPSKRARVGDPQMAWGNAAANPSYSSTGAFTAPMNLFPPTMQLNSQMASRPPALPPGFIAHVNAGWSPLPGQPAPASAPSNDSNANSNLFAPPPAFQALPQLQQITQSVFTGQNAMIVPPAAQAPSGNLRPPPPAQPAASFSANNPFASTPQSSPPVQPSGARPPRVPSTAATGAAGMSQPPAASHASLLQALLPSRTPSAQAAAASSSRPSRQANPFVSEQDDSSDNGIQRQQEEEPALHLPRRRRSPQTVRPGQHRSDPRLTEALLAPSTFSVSAQSGLGSHHILINPPARPSNKQKKPTELTIASPVIRAEIGFDAFPLELGDEDRVAYLGATSDLADASVTADGKYVSLIKVARDTNETMFNEPTIHHQIFPHDSVWNNWFAFQRWRILGRVDVFAREQLSTLAVNMQSIQRQEAIAQHKILCQMYAEIDIGEMAPGKELETSTLVRDYFMPLPVPLGPEYRNHLIEPRDVQRIENALFHFARFIMDNFPPDTHQRIKEKLSRIQYDDPEKSLRRLMRRRIMQVHQVAVETLRDHFGETQDGFATTDDAKDLMEKFRAEHFLTFHTKGYTKFVQAYGEVNAPPLATTFLAHTLKQFETPKFIRMAMAVVTVEMMSYLLYYTTVSVYHHRAQPGVESPFAMVQSCLARIRDIHKRMAATTHGQRFTLYPGLLSTGKNPVTIRIIPTIALSELTSSGHLSNSTGYMARTAKLPVNADAKGNYHATIAAYMTPTETMQAALAREFESIHELPEPEQQTVEASIRAQFWWKFHSGYAPNMLAFSGLSSIEVEDADWNTEGPMAPATNQVEREQEAMRQLMEEEQQEAQRSRRDQQRAAQHAEARRSALHGGDAASARDVAQQRADELAAQDSEERAAATAAAVAPAAATEESDDDSVEIVDLRDDATAKQALLDAKKAADKWAVIVVRNSAIVANAEKGLREAISFNLANKDDEAGKAASAAKKAVFKAAKGQHAASVATLDRLERKVSFLTRAPRSTAPPRAAAAAAQPSDGVPQVKTEAVVKKEMGTLMDRVEKQKNELAVMKRLLFEAQTNSIMNEISLTGARDSAQEELDQMRAVLSQRDTELQNIQSTVKEAELEVNKLNETNAQVLAERQSLQDQLDAHRTGQSVADPGGLMVRIGELDGKAQALEAKSKSAKQKLTENSSKLNRMYTRRDMLKSQISAHAAAAAGSRPAAAASDPASSSFAAAAAAADPASSSSAAAAAAAPPRISRAGRAGVPNRTLADYV